MRIVGVNTWPNRVSHVVFAWQLVGFKACTCFNIVACALIKSA